MEESYFSSTVVKQNIFGNASWTYPIQTMSFSTGTWRCMYRTPSLVQGINTAPQPASSTLWLTRNNAGSPPQSVKQLSKTHTINV